MAHLVLAPGVLHGLVRPAVWTGILMALFAGIGMVVSSRIDVPTLDSLPRATIHSPTLVSLSKQRTGRWATTQPVDHGAAVAFQLRTDMAAELVPAAHSLDAGRAFVMIEPALELDERQRLALTHEGPWQIALLDRHVVQVSGPAGELLPFSLTVQALNDRATVRGTYGVACIVLAAALFGIMRFFLRDKR